LKQVKCFVSAFFQGYSSSSTFFQPNAKQYLKAEMISIIRPHFNTLRTGDADLRF